MTISYLPLAVGYGLTGIEMDQEHQDNQIARLWLLKFQNRSSYAARTHGLEIRRWRLFLSARYGLQHDLFFKASSNDLADYIKLLLLEDGSKSTIIDKDLLSLCGFHSQPFIRKRSTATVNTAIVILESFYDFISESNCRQPLLCRKEVWQFKPIEQKEKNFSQSAFRDALEAMFKTAERGIKISKFSPRYHRALWIIQLTLFQKFHRTELVNLKMGDFIQDRVGSWSVELVRKKGLKRNLALKTSTVDALFFYRKSLGLSPSIVPGDDTPAILSLNHFEGQSKLKVKDLVDEIAWLANETILHLKELGDINSKTLDFLNQCAFSWFQPSGVNHKIFTLWNRIR